MSQYLTIANNRRQLVTAISTSAGAADANKLGRLGSAGQYDPSLLPEAVAYENLFLNPSFLLTRPASGFRSAAALWRWTPGTGGVATQSVQPFSPTQTDVPGAKNYLEFVQTTGATSSTRPSISQHFEGAEWNAGRTLTVGMWIWTDVPQSGVFFQYQQGFGTGGSATVSLGSPSLALSTANGWQYRSHTFTLPTIDPSAIFGTSSFVAVRLLFATATTFTARIALPTLHLGSIAAPWRDRSVGLERQLCARYWQRVPVIFDGNVTSGVSYTASGLILPMRTTPTLTGTNVINTSFGATPSLSYQFSNGEAWIEDTRAATATGRGRIVSIVECSAELL